MWKGFGQETVLGSMEIAPVSLKEYWDRAAVQAAQPNAGNGSGVAPAGRMAPVSSRLRAR